MCKFMSSFPKNTDIIGAPKRNANLEMFLRPCRDEKTYYRLRLLAFESKDGRRKDPHITRMVHTAWIKDPKTGKNRLERVICPSKTKFIETEGPKVSACKICSFATQQWSIYNESGKSDTTARVTADNTSAKFEGIVPVYVRNDPNYEKNNGKCKVIIFNKDDYTRLRNSIKAKLNEGVAVFNGGVAVDCLLHVSIVEVEGKNGKTYKNKVIDKIKFSTEPREVPAINGKLIDAFQFDDTYMASSDDDEINDFYNKHCAISNDDIPEDDEIPVYKAPAKKVVESVKVPVNDIPADNDDISDDDLDSIVDNPKNDLATDPDEEGLEVKDSPKQESDDLDSDDILKELGI